MREEPPYGGGAPEQKKYALGLSQHRPRTRTGTDGTGQQSTSRPRPSFEDLGRYGGSRGVAKATRLLRLILGRGQGREFLDQPRT